MPKYAFAMSLELILNCGYQFIQTSAVLRELIWLREQRYGRKEQYSRKKDEGLHEPCVP